MKAHLLVTAAVALLMAAGGASAQLAEPKIKILAAMADPMADPVLIGRVTAGGMVFELGLEASEAMWMQMGDPPVWREHAPGAKERYHVELKLSDPETRTRIPYANINFTTTNSDNAKTMTLLLAPMWGGTGLHYSANSALLGDGRYAAMVTVDTPTFQRELKDKDLWSKPVSAQFHFRLKDGKLSEVSEILEASQ